MTKYISLFGATTTDTRVQVVKENQVIIGIGAGASRKRYVVYKVEHTARGYVYHMVDTETKEISQTDILRPLSQTFGIGRYYDDVNPEFMDALRWLCSWGRRKSKPRRRPSPPPKRKPSMTA